MLGDESMGTNVREIAHLMKCGSSDEINAYFKKMKKEQAQEEDFYTFFNRKIDESPYKRAEVAQRAGMSKDYTYKILRGDKKTTERDYILALCLAMRLDLFDTQRALELYPFPVLNEEEPRGAIIVAGVIYKVGVVLPPFGLCA